MTLTSVLQRARLDLRDFSPPKSTLKVDKGRRGSMGIEDPEEENDRYRWERLEEEEEEMDDLTRCLR